MDKVWHEDRCPSLLVVDACRVLCPAQFSFDVIEAFVYGAREHDE